MADIAKQGIDRAGLVDPTMSTAAGGGDKFIPGNDTFLMVVNGDASPTDVTVATPKTVGGLEIEELEVTVGAGETAFIGPFPPNYFADPEDDGKAAITYSSVTSLTVAVLELAR